MSDGVNSFAGGNAITSIVRATVRPVTGGTDLNTSTNSNGASTAGTPTPGKLAGTGLAPTTDTSSASASTSTTTLDQQLQAGSLSNRLYDDPLAGIVVTQEVNSSGEVTQQTPSSSVLAYLRNGLTIEGYAKQTATA